MAFTGAFTATQSSNIENITITDTSSYSSEGQGTFSGRKVYLYKIDGTTIVPSGTSTTYIDFPFSAGNSITISGVLLRDYSLSINVVWTSLAPQPGSTYTKATITTFLNYLKQFRYQRVQDLSAQPTLINDTNWQSSIRDMQNAIKNASSANDYADQFAAQSQIDQAYVLVNNQNKYF